MQTAIDSSEKTNQKTYFQPKLTITLTTSRNQTYDQTVYRYIGNAISDRDLRVSDWEEKSVQG